MAKEVVRIKLKSYDHRVLDNAAAKIVATVKRTGGEVSGPVPLPTEIEKITIDPFWGMIIFCNVNFKKRAGLKNGGKTLCEHYTRKDVHHIRQMIVKHYFNRIKFN